jgi:tRNA (guanine37-N1)-methyltransferase
MKISLVTLFPDLYNPFLQTSLIRRAQEKGLISSEVVSMLKSCAPKERVDAPTFGHGPGMLIRPEVIERVVEEQEKKSGPAYKIFFSPHGKKLTQPLLKELYAKILRKTGDTESGGGHVMTIAARYEGIDARAEDIYADEIISLGDFVLMGGDLPAMVLLEGLLRLVPGVIGTEQSVEEESFSGPFVDYPHYTAPVEWKGLKVPDVIRSGDHAAIAAWRQQEAVKRTVAHHFDWVRSQALTPVEKKLVLDEISPHYVALMHTGVMVASETGARQGTTSVTSIDIHDIARSAKTYGIEHYFVVTSLEDQQKIVDRLLEFWQEGAGVTYREDRHEALKSVSYEANLDAVIEIIEKKEGKKPIIIVTSAQEQIGKVVAENKNITYYDQERVWAHRRPILILFGTGNGLAPSIMERADYVLVPVEGFTTFNHLSVRSAAAIILDRWLGIQKK